MKILVTAVQATLSFVREILFVKDKQLFPGWRHYKLPVPRRNAF